MAVINNLLYEKHKKLIGGLTPKSDNAPAKREYHYHSLTDQSRTDDKEEKSSYSTDDNLVLQKQHYRQQDLFHKYENKEEETSLDKPLALDSKISGNISNKKNEKKHLFDFLQYHRFDRDYIKVIMDKLDNYSINDDVKAKELVDKIVDELAFDNFNVSTEETMFVFFVGPAGSGKTTNMFKYAIELVQSHGKEVYLTCFNDKNLYASLQVQKFADIFGVPYRRIREEADFVRLKEDSGSGSIILVDMVGISLSDKVAFSKCRQMISFIPEKNKKTILTLPSSMGEREKKNIVNQFVSFGVSAICCTRVDESLSFGGSLSLSRKYGLPIGLVSTGQDIPNDLLAISKETMAKLVYQNWINLATITTFRKKKTRLILMLLV